MKDMYNVSLCQNGILGGMLYIKETELLYCTNKSTVPENIRRLHMLFDKIEKIELTSFHTITITMKNKENYRFFLLFRKKLIKTLSIKQNKDKIG